MSWWRPVHFAKSRFMLSCACVRLEWKVWIRKMCGQCGWKLVNQSRLFSTNMNGWIRMNGWVIGFAGIIRLAGVIGLTGIIWLRTICGICNLCSWMRWTNACKWCINGQICEEIRYDHVGKWCSYNSWCRWYKACGTCEHNTHKQQCWLHIERFDFFCFSLLESLI